MAEKGVLQLKEHVVALLDRFAKRVTRTGPDNTALRPAIPELRVLTNALQARLLCVVRIARNGAESVCLGACIAGAVLARGVAKARLGACAGVRRVAADFC